MRMRAAARRARGGKDGPICAEVSGIGTSRDNRSTCFLTRLSCLTDLQRLADRDESSLQT